MQKKTSNKPSAASSGQILLSFLFLLFACAAPCQSAWYKSNCPRSQKQAGVWYFGEKAGIDFRTGSAVALTDENVMNALQATSSICDSMGNFRFFTNGRIAWDRTFSRMPNATVLDGYPGVTQPCLIVPYPGNESLYYIFTIDLITYDHNDSTKYTTKGLSYTLIDMKLRGDSGDAVSAVLNKPLLSPVCQKITAVANRDQKGIWVIAHKWESNEFYAYLVTNAGIASPVISAVGSTHSAVSKLARNNAMGYMKCSPDGSKLALAITYDKLIEVFDFDNGSGKLTNPKSFHVAKSVLNPYAIEFSPDSLNPYGIEFSPDSKKLYSTVLDYLGGVFPRRPTYIFQFDLVNGLNTPVIIDSVAGVRMNAMQLAIDGRIYLSRTNNHNSKRDSLDVIYNPNRLGTACNFNLLQHVPGSRFDLSGRKSMYSLPNFVQSYVNIPPFTWDSVCHGNNTQFHITNTANIDSLTWDFGDKGTSGIPDPMHEYASPGKYWVKLTEKFNGQAYTDSMQVSNYPLPVISLGDTVLLYAGSTINLHAGGGFTDYLWSTGSPDSVINVNSQGSYWAQVKDYHCCINSDTTFVKVFEYFIPNAFSPNGDGINDFFRVNGLYKNIDFNMVVYDRWGQQVFQSDDIDKGWDGNVGGQYCPPESYVWIVHIGFLGQDIITKGDIVFKGTVTIVR
ncbi:MAG: gliding motility-associated C-terminal domain-containing protein [Bacteroidetes bacterium]|nr:gliding motility-associated C-terminal domain-containing protein [Bacteroidota bacterium]